MSFLNRNPKHKEAIELLEHRVNKIKKEMEVHENVKKTATNKIKECKLAIDILEASIKELDEDINVTDKTTS